MSHGAFVFTVCLRVLFEKCILVRLTLKKALPFVQRDIQNIGSGRLHHWRDFDDNGVPWADGDRVFRQVAELGMNSQGEKLLQSSLCGVSSVTQVQVKNDFELGQVAQLEWEALQKASSLVSHDHHY